MLSSNQPLQYRRSCFYQWQNNLPLAEELALKAESLGIKWGTWVHSQKHYAVFSGETCDYELSQHESYLHRLKTIQNSHAHVPQSKELPWALVLRRFNDYSAHAQKNKTLPHTDSLWKGWGSLGTVWFPSIAFCYDELTQSGCLAWLNPQQDLGLVNVLFTDLLHHKEAEETSENESLAESRVLLNNPEQLSPLLTQEDFATWSKRIEAVKSLCTQDKLSKAVLARSWKKVVNGSTQWSGAKVFQKLIAKAQTNEIPFAFSLQPQVTFVGLSPETLFSMEQDIIHTHALAGTRMFNQHMSEAEKKDLVVELKQAPKDQQEHHIVVEQIKDTLTHLCKSVTIAERGIKTLRHLVHLETPIMGELKPDISGFQILEALHPTPALGGAPKELALSLINEQEPFHRGGYAAPWMWSNSAQEMTSVVGIRSALIHAEQAFVFAGAGIVADSIAELEWEETQAKANVMASILDHQVCVSVDTKEYQQTQKCSPAQSVLWRCLEMIKNMMKLGLSGAVISPGSRNTPLALALQHLLPYEICVDERSAAFVALGWAKSTHAPIALCCTSGSAGAHYLPALIEAWYSAIPLVVMTADRPPRLRNSGAAQTINQLDLYGSYVKHSVDLPVEPLKATASTRIALNRSWKELGAYALQQAQTLPHAPTHINVPFEEPLWDLACDDLLNSLSVQKQAVSNPLFTSLISPVSMDVTSLIPQKLFDALITSLIQKRGLIYCGPLSPHDAQQLEPILEQISQFSQWPIFTESSAQFRDKPWSFSSFDAFTRSSRDLAQDLADQIPQAEQCDCLLMIGGGPHSRSVRAWLQTLTPKQCFYLGSGPETIDPDGYGLTRLGHTLYEGHAILQKAIQKAQIIRSNSTQDLDHQRKWFELWTKVEKTWQQYLDHSEIFNLIPPLLNDKSNTSTNAYTHASQSHLNHSLWGGSVVAGLTYVLNQLKPSIFDLYQDHSMDFIVASSMAFRDHDLLWSANTKSSAIPTRIWVNRGANGIDGTFSTALGIAKGTQSLAPLVIYLGDLANYHDLQGLHKLAQWHTQQPTESQRPVIVLMVNNDGGGIFKHLPIRQAQSYTSLFQTSLSSEPNKAIDWSSLALAFHWDFVQVSKPTTLTQALTQALVHPHLSFIELKVDADFDHRCHQTFWRHFTQFMSQSYRGQL